MVPERDLTLVVVADLELTPSTAEGGPDNRCCQVVQESLESMAGADEDDVVLGVSPGEAWMREREFERRGTNPRTVSSVVASQHFANRFPSSDEACHVMCCWGSRDLFLAEPCASTGRGCKAVRSP